MDKWVFDSEIYVNFYCVGFKNIKTKEVRSYRTPFTPACVSSINSILQKHTVIGFNSLNFDLPLLNLALDGVSDVEIKKRCDGIIKNNLKWWKGRGIPRCLNHVDLIEVAPGVASLKIYGGRLNSPRMQSLPIHHDKVLTEEEKDLIEEYMLNDLDVTEMLCRALDSRLALRKQMGDEYGVNLMSKSDAQIAEAVFKYRLPELGKPDDKTGHTFRYKAPSWVPRHLADPIEAAEFIVQSTGKVKLPEFFPKNVYKGYKLGIGGLHSMEKSVSHFSSGDVVISDHDVASYYPSIILNEKLMEKTLLDEYAAIVDERLSAKAMGDKDKADMLKIVINGSFGKFGNKYSVLYDPEMLIKVTLTGQLALLTLIEMFEDAGVEVISANTDGVVVKTADLAARDEVIRIWEHKTRFVTEETRYRALHSRDVNNYLAIKTDGSWKGKGCFAPPSLAKSPEHPIVYEAVAKYLVDGVCIRETICNCETMTKFCSIRTVKNGALSPEGIELGTAIRWYYSTESKGPITYVVNGNKVPKTDGSRELMELEWRDDIDYDWYIEAAKGVLKDVGVDY